MYHIKSDKRSQASAGEILRGLELCLKEKPLKAITVSDIHRVTGISRATFYRLFDTPEDVLEYWLTRMMEDMPAIQASEEMTIRQVMEASIAQGMAQHTIMKALVDNGRFDLIFQYTEKNFRLLDQRYGLFPGDLQPVEREYIIAQFTMNMLATLITWSRNGQKETPAQVMGYLKRYSAVVESIVEGEL